MSEAIHEGEPSGDAFLVRPRGDGILIAVLDALGHGAPAAEVAALACATLTREADAPLPWLLERCHTALRDTRGAAMGIAAFRPDNFAMEWLAVGNIQAVLARVGPEGRVTTSPLRHQHGILGRAHPAGVPESLTLRDRDVLVLATDGIRPTFIEDLTPLAEPWSLVRRLLLRHRRVDDALALVARFRTVSE